VGFGSGLKHTQKRLSQALAPDGVFLIEEDSVRYLNPSPSGLKLRIA
jgi:hypothetical protein